MLNLSRPPKLNFIRSDTKTIECEIETLVYDPEHVVRVESNGVVYKGKLLYSNLAVNAKQLTRAATSAEARLLKTNHPNVVSMYQQSVGPAESRCLTLCSVDTQSFMDYIKSPRTEMFELWSLCLDFAAAVTWIHNYSDALFAICNLSLENIGFEQLQNSQSSTKLVLTDMSASVVFSKKMADEQHQQVNAFPIPIENEYTAPELLTPGRLVTIEALRNGDVYSFAKIVKSILSLHPECKAAVGLKSLLRQATSKDAQLRPTMTSMIESMMAETKAIHFAWALHKSGQHKAAVGEWFNMFRTTNKFDRPPRPDRIGARTFYNAMVNSISTFSTPSSWISYPVGSGSIVTAKYDAHHKIQAIERALNAKAGDKFVTFEAYMRMVKAFGLINTEGFIERIVSVVHAVPLFDQRVLKHHEIRRHLANHEVCVSYPELADEAALLVSYKNRDSMVDPDQVVVLKIVNAPNIGLVALEQSEDIAGLPLIGPIASWVNVFQ